MDTRTGTGERVLVVDDEKALCIFAQRMLEKLGYEVTIALEGEEAVQEYISASEEGRPYHVVIVDLTLPRGIGGRDVMKKLLEFDPDATGVVSSGNPGDSVMVNYEDHGFQESLAKPYDLNELRRLMNSLFELRTL